MGNYRGKGRASYAGNNNRFSCQEYPKSRINDTNHQTDSNTGWRNTQMYVIMYVPYVGFQDNKDDIVTL